MSEKSTLTWGQEVTISLKALYNAQVSFVGQSIEMNYEKIDDSEYFDLLDCSDGRVLCMDGETCTVKEVTKDGVTFLNESGDFEETFFLKNHQVEIAIFS